MYLSPSDDAGLWLALIQVPRFGVARLRRLLARHGLAELFDLPAAELGRLGLNAAQVSALKQPDWSQVEQQLRWLEHPDQGLVPFDSAHYPRLLQEISTPPLLLFIAGDATVLQQPQVAVVGSRNPSVTGRENASAFAGELVDKGYAVTSGLAMGIDASAHRGALAADGRTLAVLGSGIDCLYPAANRSLAEQIRESGALISEFLPATPPRRQHFPRRNRVIAGLTLGTLVVEATPRSGSLITARLALEQNRDVFAIPGSIHNPLAQGCNRLIAEGAALVTSVDDIEQLLTGWQPMRPVELPAPDLTSSAITDLVDQVGFEPTSVDQLANRSGLAIEALLRQLLELELEGEIVAVPGGYVRQRR